MDKGYIVINLLPYRDRIKKEKLKQFGILVGTFAVAAAALIFAGSMYLDLQQEDQTNRNTYVEKKNKDLDEQIKEIASLKEEIRETLSKRQVVENLQTDRSDAVNILNELSKQLPEGVTLKSVKQTLDKIAIVGTTAVNTKVANYMSNLENTEIFQNAQVIEVKLINSVTNGTDNKGKKVTNTTQESEFLLTVDLKPKVVEVKEKDKPKDTKGKKAKD